MCPAVHLACRPRERHVFVRLMACQQIFERIALSRANLGSYLQFRERQQHHITDMLEPATDSGNYSAVSAAAAVVGGKAEGRGSVDAAGQHLPHVTSQALVHRRDEAAATGAAQVKPSHRHQ